MPKQISTADVPFLANRRSVERKLRGTARIVFVRLLCFADKAGVGNVTNSDLATETGYMVRTVRRIMGELERDGYIRREPPAAGKAHGAFTLILEAEPAAGGA